MKSWKDLNIKPASMSLIGESISLEKLLDTNIILLDYIIKPSTKKTGTNCLYLQIEHDDQKRVVFTGSEFLIDLARMIDRKDLPIQTKIVKVNRHYEFTDPTEFVTHKDYGTCELVTRLTDGTAKIKRKGSIESEIIYISDLTQ